MSQGPVPSLHPSLPISLSSVISVAQPPRQPPQCKLFPMNAGPAVHSCNSCDSWFSRCKPKNARGAGGGAGHDIRLCSARWRLGCVRRSQLVRRQGNHRRGRRRRYWGGTVHKPRLGAGGLGRGGPRREVHRPVDVAAGARDDHLVPDRLWCGFRIRVRETSPGRTGQGSKTGGG